MKANELMIGNWVLTENGEMQIIVISENCDVIKHHADGGYTTGHVPVKDLQPIKLTEDWLVKFGFVKNNRHYTKDMYDDKFMAVYFPIEQYKDGSDYEVQLYGEMHSQISVDVFNVRNTAIKYVHQLQNLYFIITGTPLTLTPPEK